MSDLNDQNAAYFGRFVDDICRRRREEGVALLEQTHERREKSCTRCGVVTVYMARRDREDRGPQVCGVCHSPLDPKHRTREEGSRGM